MNELFTGLNLAFIIGFAVMGLILGLRRVPLNDWGGHFVSIGILGTFAGILVSLMGFDTTAIDKSVPQLLDGMRTAFATSVLGMGIAVGTKAIALLLPRGDVPVGEPSPEDYLKIMRAQQKALEALQASVGGEGDKAVLTQLGLLRTDMNDFMKRLEKQSTDAIIAALRQVVQDFNHNLTTQFGDNFKQLNQAVGAMLTFMEQHKALSEATEARVRQAMTAVEAMRDAQKDAADSQATAAAALTESAAAATELRIQAEEAVGAAAKVGPALTEGAAALKAVATEIAKVREEMNRLGGDAARLGGAIDQLRDATQPLTAAMNQLQELSNEAGSTAARLKGMVDATKASAEAVTAQHAAVSVELKQQVKILADSLGGAQRTLIQGLGTAMTEQLGLQTKALAAAQSKQLNDMAEVLRQQSVKNHEAVDKQVQALDRALEDELNRAMSTLVGKLASLSEKFVADYTPLTQELARVVNLAKSIEAERRRLPGG